MDIFLDSIYEPSHGEKPYFFCELLECLYKTLYLQWIKKAYILNLTKHIRNLRRKIRNYCVNSNISVSILYYFHKIICSSLRCTQDRRTIAEQDNLALSKKNGEEIEPKPIVFCLWHDELFSIILAKKDLDAMCVVSSSKDGTILKKLLEKMGFHTVSGSSRRDGLKALLSGVRMMRKDGTHVCITIDGPMGPRHKAKDGAFFFAQKGNAKIIPTRIITHNALRIPSWDKFQFPLPFSKVDVLFGEGFFVTEELSEENLEIYRDKLEKELAGLAPYKD